MSILEKLSYKISTCTWNDCESYYDEKCIQIFIGYNQRRSSQMVHSLGKGERYSNDTNVRP